MKKFKAISFLVILTLLFSLSVSAAVTEEALQLGAGNAAQGHLDGAAGYLCLGWANDGGMRFDVLDGEVLTGVNIQTVVAGKPIKATLFKWKTNIADKVLLEEKEFTSTDWSGVPFEFDKVYPAGTYYVMVTSLDTSVPEPYLYIFDNVIEGRNVEAYQGDRTFANLSEETGRNFGKSFSLTINFLKGVTGKAQTFLTKYHEVKASVADGATIYDQAKYDAVMNAVEGDMKAFIKGANDETLTNYTNDLTAAMTKPNPETGDQAIFFALLLVVGATLVILKKNKIKAY